jgi:hypothetical protein
MRARSVVKPIRYCFSIPKTHLENICKGRRHSGAEFSSTFTGGLFMPRYGKSAQKTVKSAMHRRKKGTLRSGKGGKGGRVKSRKQAIAIGLSEARKKGAKVPRKKSS